MAHRQGSVRGWWNSTVEWNQRCRIGTLGGACERRKSQPGSWQPAAISMLQCELLKDFLLMSRLVKRQAADAVVDPVHGTAVFTAKALYISLVRSARFANLYCMLRRMLHRLRILHAYKA